MISYPHYGEGYLTVHTIQELEGIKRDRKKLAATRQVAVANLG